MGSNGPKGSLKCIEMGQGSREPITYTHTSVFTAKGSPKLTFSLWFSRPHVKERKGEEKREGKKGKRGNKRREPSQAAFQPIQDRFSRPLQVINTTLASFLSFVSRIKDCREIGLRKI